MLQHLKLLSKQFKVIKVLLPVDVRRQGQSIVNALHDHTADSADVYELQQIVERCKFYRPHRLLNSFGITEAIAKLQKYFN